MAIQLKRSSIFWFIFAMLMFVGSVKLIIMVTAVHGRPPFVPGNANDELVADQLVAIFQPKTSADPSDKPLIYIGINLPLPAGISIENVSEIVTYKVLLPPNFDGTLAITDITPIGALADGQKWLRIGNIPPCHVEELADEPTEVEYSIEYSGVEFGDRPIMLIKPTKTLTNFYIIECFTKLMVKHETFTRNSFSIYISGDFKGDPMKAANFRPVSAITLRGDVIGGENSFPEKQDIIPGPIGHVVHVYWSDLISEQLHDIILVLIGIFMATAAAALIEGLRPIVDQMDRR